MVIINYIYADFPWIQLFWETPDEQICSTSPMMIFLTPGPPYTSYFGDLPPAMCSIFPKICK